MSLLRIHSELAGLYTRLELELSWLHAKFTIFKQLFTDTERVRFLADTAPSFFRIIQDVLRDDIFISLSRLTDPPVVSRRQNLCVRRLADSCEMLNEEAFHGELLTYAHKIEATCAPFRLWRNKRIAHSDLPTVLRYTKDPLPGISLSMIERALELLRRYLNYFIDHFESSETAYEHVILRGDGDTIVWYLERAQELARIEKERALRGSRPGAPGA